MDAASSLSQPSYQYLYDKLFEVVLNRDYLIALTYYAAFALTLALTLVIRVRRSAGPLSRPGVVVVSHSVLLTISAGATLASYLIVRQSLQDAIVLNQSAYAVTRSGAVGDLFTLHQVLNRVAILPLALGLAVALSGGQPRYIGGLRSSRYILPYLLLLAILYVYCALIGNKNELFLGLVGASLFYLSNAHQPRAILLGLSACTSLVMIILVDWIRAIPASEITTAVNLSELATVITNLRTSNEAYGSHLSMYGVLHFEVPLTYGSSITSLAASLIPRILWPERPPDIYMHYAESVQAVAGQGYSIHHATGWYLNFGFVGVVLGAIILGGVWATLFNAFHRNHPKNIALRILVILGPSMFVASLPSLIRSGLEGYKGVAIDSFLVPVACLFVSSLLTRQAMPAPLVGRLRSTLLSPRGLKPSVRHLRRVDIHSNRLAPGPRTLDKPIPARTRVRTSGNKSFQTE